jgi:hypothetical protein
MAGPSPAPPAPPGASPNLAPCPLLPPAPPRNVEAALAGASAPAGASAASAAAQGCDQEGLGPEARHAASADSKAVVPREPLACAREVQPVSYFILASRQLGRCRSAAAHAERAKAAGRWPCDLNPPLIRTRSAASAASIC